MTNPFLIYELLKSKIHVSKNVKDTKKRMVVFIGTPSIKLGRKLIKKVGIRTTQSSVWSREICHVPRKDKASGNENHSTNIYIQPKLQIKTRELFKPKKALHHKLEMLKTKVENRQKPK